ncbi:MAG: hypothetical protein LUI05_08075, partial [Oscillospiraceae bacterium]|nr:hypothetical protein [Oscillospiraceae bacterium]
MNMKKTIAAVAAGAVALSAMATTVSAESGSLHYNLVNTEYSATGSVTYTMSLNYGSTNTIDDDLSILLRVPSVCDISTAQWTISGTIANASGDSKQISYVNYVASDITWMANASSYVAQDWSQTAIFTIPVDESGVDSATSVNVTIQVVVPHTDTTWGYSVLNDAVAYVFENDGSSNLYYLTDGSGNVFLWDDEVGYYIDDTNSGGTAGVYDKDYDTLIADSGTDWVQLSVTGSNYVYPSEAVSTQ